MQKKKKILIQFAKISNLLILPNYDVNALQKYPTNKLLQAGCNACSYLFTIMVVNYNKNISYHNDYDGYLEKVPMHKLHIYCVIMNG